jgi:hypothetical protein
MRTHIHASNGIRTHDPSARAAEGSNALDRAATATGDAYIYEIIFRAFLCLCNYYNGPPAWGLGEGLNNSSQ